MSQVETNLQEHVKMNLRYIPFAFLTVCTPQLFSYYQQSTFEYFPAT